jgi:hypothetical protein
MGWATLTPAVEECTTRLEGDASAGEHSGRLETVLGVWAANIGVGATGRSPLWVAPLEISEFGA